MDLVKRTPSLTEERLRKTMESDVKQSKYSMFRFGLNQYFNIHNSDYIFTSSPGVNQFMISSKSGSETKLCVTLNMNFENNELKIELLDTCHISGSTIMKTIIDFCKIHNINIKLLDVSVLDFKFKDGSIINIDLKKLKILQIGTSWYGSMGFKNEFITENQQFLQKFINSPLSRIYSLINMALPSETNPFVSENRYLQALKKEHNAFIKKFPDFLNLDEPICNIFKKIQTFIKDLCIASDCETEHRRTIEFCNAYIEKTFEILIACFLLYTKNPVTITNVEKINRQVFLLSFNINMSEHINPYQIGKRINLKDLMDDDFNGMPATIESEISHGRVKVRLPDHSLRSVKLANIKGGKRKFKTKRKRAKF